MKYRSIRAFKNYENRSRTLDPFRVVSLLKREPQGLRKGKIAIELNTDPAQVDNAVSLLRNKKLVRVDRKDGDEWVLLE